jgi:hypothetical protein
LDLVPPLTFAPAWPLGDGAPYDTLASPFDFVVHDVSRAAAEVEKPDAVPSRERRDQTRGDAASAVMPVEPRRKRCQDQDPQ